MDGQISIFDFPEYLPDQKAEFVMYNSNCRGCEFFEQGYYKVDERTGATWHYDCPGTSSENYPNGTPVNITLMLQDQESLDCFVKPKLICKLSNHSKLDIPKAPIWHVSLNHVWEECPNCKIVNKAQDDVRVGYGAEAHYIYVNRERCINCGQLFDWSDEAIEKACKYSKDYPRG